MGLGLNGVTMVVVAQLVRALVCGTRGRGFESRLPPNEKSLTMSRTFFISTNEARFKFVEIKKGLGPQPKDFTLAGSPLWDQRS